MEQKEITLKVLTPTGVVFDGVADHVTFPGEMGSFTVFPRHAPIISALAKGEIVVHGTQGEQRIKLESGIVEIKDDRATASIEQ